MLTYSDSIIKLLIIAMVHVVSSIVNTTGLNEVILRSITYTVKDTILEMIGLAKIIATLKLEVLLP